MTSKILLFDLGALLSHDIHFWRQVSNLGECIVPQAVITEISQIIEGLAADGSYEQRAAEFSRFMATSDWQVRDVSVTNPHPVLSQKLGNALSHKSRLDLGVTQAAYAIAISHPETTIVLVTDQQKLSQVINQLHIANLMAKNSATVRQWLKTKVIPESIANEIASPNTTSTSVRSQANLARFHKLVISLVSWAIVSLIALMVWRSLQPKQFQQVWQKIGLPNLPKK